MSAKSMGISFLPNESAKCENEPDNPMIVEVGARPYHQSSMDISFAFISNIIFNDRANWILFSSHLLRQIYFLRAFILKST